jgi:acyl-CoA thioester hydrolase
MQLEQVQALPFHVRVTIPADYLDIFGHMNIQFYLKIFSDSVFDMCAEMGMDEAFFLSSGRGMYALEQHIKYMAEVREGETIATYSRLFGRNEKRVHFMHFMVNETRQNVAATLEVMALHVDRQTKKAAVFPPEIAATADERIATDRALTWEAPHSQALGI